jgi:Photosynthesis system II assembly factor YCF48
MPDQDRNQIVEEWLRQTPVAGARVDDCLDAETLAAWSEGLLDGPERSSAEAHAANCARCQAMLAVMVRTTPAPAGATGWPFRKWLMMLGPAMAAAAAVALWLAVDRRQTPSVIDDLSKAQAKTERAAEGAPVAAPPAVGVEKEVRDAPKVTADARREVGDRAGARTPSESRAMAAPENERTEGKDVASAKRADKSIDAERLRAAAPEPAAAPVSTPPPAPPAATENVTAAAASRPVVVAPPGPAPQQQANQAANQNQAQTQNQASPRQQAPGALEERVIVTGEQPLGRAASDAAAASRSAGRGGAAGGFADAAALSYRAKAGNFDVVVDETSIRWRVVDGRTIQRSLDSGVTWANHHTAENDVTLTAGSAPSSNICWLVGRSGAIVLTTDGRAWRRIKFAEAADLAAVTATDARTATVTTADGRLFGTTDGGRTWTRR